MPPIARARSPEQLAAARPEASVWVGASAGSGKTSVLSDRVLRLMLLDGARPERLLCLTFTKAAAAEMKTRVMAELAHWAAADDITPELYLYSVLQDFLLYDDMKPVVDEMSKRQPANAEVQELAAWVQIGRAHV